MDAVARKRVRDRAGNRCEYCRLHEIDDVYTHHIEHVIALKHGGTDDLQNLALACQQCNLHKGTNLSGIDPSSGAVVNLFHPRRDRWEDHFSFRNHDILGNTPTGRATVCVLNMNDPDRKHLRSELGIGE